MDKPTSQALRKIRKYNLATKLGYEKLFKLQFLGDGAYRTVYRIEGTELVVKFPKPGEGADEGDDDGDDGTRHTRAEMRRLTRLKKFKSLRRYLPVVYHYDKKNAIVVMRHYDELPTAITKASITFFDPMLRAVIRALTGIDLTDLRHSNIRLGDETSSADSPILIDVGC